MKNLITRIKNFRPSFQFIKVAAVIIAFIIFMSGLILKTEYDNLIQENENLKEQVFQLKRQLNTSKMKANLSRLKALCEEYSDGSPDNIINLINKIDPEENEQKIVRVLDSKAGATINTMFKIKKAYDNYQSKLSEQADKIAPLEDKIEDLEEEVNDLEGKGYRYIKLRIGRRFDTDYVENKGIYETVHMSSLSTVVLIASEKEADVDYRGESKTFLVKPEGEKEVTVTKSNAYRNWKVTEYYDVYRTVDRSKNPYIKKKELRKLKQDLRNLKRDLKKDKKDLTDDLSEKTNQYARKIIELTN